MLERRAQGEHAALRADEGSAAEQRLKFWACVFATGFFLYGPQMLIGWLLDMVNGSENAPKGTHAGEIAARAMQEAATACGRRVDMKRRKGAYVRLRAVRGRAVEPPGVPEARVRGARLLRRRAARHGGREPGLGRLRVRLPRGDRAAGREEAAARAAGVLRVCMSTSTGMGMGIGIGMGMGMGMGMLCVCTWCS